jgi:ParB-like chromosome segregation protein Spo0J
MDFYDQRLAKVDDLIPYALNSRTHSDEQVAQLAASIKEFGFTNPVLIDEGNNLIAGHGRLLAARKLKMDQVPAVVVTGLDDRKRRALIIADNKLALNAGWDEEALRVELEDLSADFGELMGFSNEELGELLKGEEVPDFAPGTEDDQGKLDELAPKMVTCPHCQTEWDLREHGQG